ncbi:collagen alpha-1(I) chain-like [Kogia breviceps]|uniref:collagen alpha-1(I) chain-like n=1 Tax=Kogia breviceps TaxID=27615 RepID=UPI0034D284DC
MNEQKCSALLSRAEEFTREKSRDEAWQVQKLRHREMKACSLHLGEEPGPRQRLVPEGEAYDLDAKAVFPKSGKATRLPTLGLVLALHEAPAPTHHEATVESRGPSTATAGTAASPASRPPPLSLGPSPPPASEVAQRATNPAEAHGGPHTAAGLVPGEPPADSGSDPALTGSALPGTTWAFWKKHCQGGADAKVASGAFPGTRSTGTRPLPGCRSDTKTDQEFLEVHSKCSEFKMSIFPARGLGPARCPDKARSAAAEALGEPAPPCFRVQLRRLPLQEAPWAALPPARLLWLRALICPASPELGGPGALDLLPAPSSSITAPSSPPKPRAQGAKLGDERRRQSGEGPSPPLDFGVTLHGSHHTSVLTGMGKGPSPTEARGPGAPVLLRGDCGALSSPQPGAQSFPRGRAGPRPVHAGGPAQDWVSGRAGGSLRPPRRPHVREPRVNPARAACRGRHGVDGSALVSGASQQDKGPPPSTVRLTRGKGARLGLSWWPAAPCDEWPQGLWAEGTAGSPKTQLTDSQRLGLPLETGFSFPPVTPSAVSARHAAGPVPGTRALTPLDTERPRAGPGAGALAQGEAGSDHKPATRRTPCAHCLRGPWLGQGAQPCGPGRLFGEQRRRGLCDGPLGQRREVLGTEPGQAGKGGGCGCTAALALCPHSLCGRGDFSVLLALPTEGREAGQCGQRGASRARRLPSTVQTPPGGSPHLPAAAPAPSRLPQVTRKTTGRPGGVSMGVSGAGWAFPAAASVPGPSSHPEQGDEDVGAQPPQRVVCSPPTQGWGQELATPPPSGRVTRSIPAPRAPAAAHSRAAPRPPRCLPLRDPYPGPPLCRPGPSPTCRGPQESRRDTVPRGAASPCSGPGQEFGVGGKD